MTDLTLTPERLAELKALEKAATPGPWVTRFDGAVYREVVRGEVPVCEHAGRAEAALIAVLRNAAPALIAAAEDRDELRKRAETAEKQEELWREDASKQLGELAQANLALVSAHALLVRAGEALEFYACSEGCEADACPIRKYDGGVNCGSKAKGLAAEIRRATQGETP